MAGDKKIDRSGHQFILSTVVFFLGIPLLVIAHELGHLFAARAFGYPASLSYGAVNFTLPKSEYEGIQGLTIILAGPLVNFLLAVAGVVGLLRFSKIVRPSRNQWIGIWLITLFASGGGRGLLKSLSPSGTDEAAIAERMGLPGAAGVLISAIPALAFVIFIVRFHLRAGSLWSLVVGGVAGGLSLVLWFTVVGPGLLPKPIPDEGENAADALESKPFQR